MSQGVSYLLGLLTSICPAASAELAVRADGGDACGGGFYVLCDWNRHGGNHGFLDPGAAAPGGAAPSAGRWIWRWPASCAGRLWCACCWEAITLWRWGMAGLNFGFLIGIVSGLITFIPYVGSLTGLVLAMGVAIVQVLPRLRP